MKIWKCEAAGDTVYIEATSLDAARKHLFAMMGTIPESMLKWTEVKKLPKGEEFL